MCIPGATEITDFTPLIMVIPFIEEEVEEIGRKEWLQEGPMERSNGDFNRGNGHDKNRRTQPSTSTSGLKPARQEDERLVPPTVERRDDVER